MTYGIVKNNTYYKKEHEKTKLRMAGGSWSINMAEINDNIENIVYKTNKNIYKITLKKAKEVGFYRTFQGELKLVVPELNWEKDKNERKP